MKRLPLFALTLGFPLVSFASGGDSSGLASKLSICEKMKANREKIDQVRANQNVSNRCRQAIDQAEECYKAREATKTDTEKLRGLGETQEGQPQAGMNQLGMHSAESLNMGRERYGRNSEMCRAIRDNVKKQCGADTRTLSMEHDTNYDQYRQLRAKAEAEGPRGANYADYNRQASGFLEVSAQLQAQMRANREAERAVAQGMDDESACNHSYENIYTAYAAGADNSLQLAAANGDLSSNQALSAPPTDNHNQPINEAADPMKGIKGTVTEKAVELAHGGVVPALEHGLPAAGQVALKGTGAVFPVMSAVHGDVPGAATGATQVVGEMIGSRGLAAAGLGAGVFSTVFFYQDPNFMRCDGIYYDPVQAAKAGGCPIQTTAGAMSTQSAVRTLSGD